MKTSLICQPHNSNLSSEIIPLLELNRSSAFKTFYFAVAYARRNGVEELLEHIQRFQRQGGRLKAIVGVDGNTSYQALELLLPICPRYSAKVFHDESPRRHTFHPKFYAFESPGVKAIVFVGSSNLTGGGLAQNYEMDIRIEFDLTDRKDNATFDAFVECFNEYFEDPQLCKDLSDDLIRELRKNNYLADDEKKRSTPPDAQTFTSKKKIFGSSSWIFPSPKRGSRSHRLKRKRPIRRDIPRYRYWPGWILKHDVEFKSPKELISAIKGTYRSDKLWDWNGNRKDRPGPYVIILLLRGQILGHAVVSITRRIPRRRKGKRFSFHLESKPFIFSEEKRFPLSGIAPIKDLPARTIYGLDDRLEIFQNYARRIGREGRSSLSVVLGRC